ncbi:hypothetical protein A2Y99_01470 [Candidatus Gottesmanbacteria bacterium RBG_13_37_7]|uniref:N-acetyltransferase domain-containing protein n=1 Tax=Candidatus Gottesmanbacteria bacterium RBG_13_37_7 TaxID=1798369 RepID=A0A1F5YIH7_9BACT|nr:MAG: hypothetical protein A2Y99_01470 [Candidatus Gottesmanbacteria bacterium RBG_13_37_7]
MIIKKRKLVDAEIVLINEEIRKFPDIAYVNNSIWKKFECVYIAYSNNQFIGICVVVMLNDWVKIGPFVILQKYQGKGYGKKLLTYVIKKQKNINIFVGSSNKKVAKILSKLGFIQNTNTFKLSREIKLYGLGYFLESLNLTFLKELIRKKLLFKRGKFFYYLKYK